MQYLSPVTCFVEIFQTSLLNTQLYFYSINLSWVTQNSHLSDVKPNGCGVENVSFENLSSKERFLIKEALIKHFENVS